MSVDATQTPPAPQEEGGLSAISTSTMDVLELLDEVGLDFVMHTHHPLTHLLYEDDTDVPDSINIRNECPVPPTGTPWGDTFPVL